MRASQLRGAPGRVRRGFGHGVRAALRNNVPAFGFSVMITTSFGVVSATLGAPSVGEVFLFAAGAMTGVSSVDAITSRGFRDRLGGDESDVVALGAALSYFSVGLGVGAAALCSDLFDGAPGWGVGGLAATTVYVLLSGIEMTLARIAQEDREDTGRRDRADRR